MKNILLVITGPSGVGKGTMVERLLNSEDFALSVSCTTRAPRPMEVPGKSYFFITEEEFKERITKDDFLEYDEHFGFFYGTPRSFVVEQLKTRSVLLEIDVVGALNVKKSYPEAVTVILTPPDEETLTRRLRGRGSETEEQIKNRLGRVEYELGEKNKFDYVVVDDDLEETERVLKQIIAKEKNRE